MAFYFEIVCRKAKSDYSPPLVQSHFTSSWISQQLHELQTYEPISLVLQFTVGMRDSCEINRPSCRMRQSILTVGRPSKLPAVQGNMGLEPSLPGNPAIQAPRGQLTTGPQGFHHHNIGQCQPWLMILNHPATSHMQCTNITVGFVLVLALLLLTIANRSRPSPTSSRTVIKRPIVLLKAPQRQHKNYPSFIFTSSSRRRSKTHHQGHQVSCASPPWALRLEVPWRLSPEAWSPKFPSYWLCGSLKVDSE